MQQTIITSPALPFDPRKAVIGAGMLLMAAEPLRWLAASWTDPAYDSKGLWVFALCVALIGWSLSSGRTAQQLDHRKAWLLLAATTLVRGAGQVLAVNVIGALALVIDVYALGLLAGLKGRRRALSPGWLALLFAFCLPLERILQRVGGFLLQQVSAGGACLTLKGFFDDVACNGARIIVSGHDVLVDLPCSGARMLILICILYASLMAVYRPNFTRAALIGFATLAGVLIANALRITVLAALIAHPVAGIDVMAQPWHDITGLVFLAAAAAPLIFLCSRIPQARTAVTSAPVRQVRPVTWLPACLFLILAAAIVALPRKPVDVAAAAPVEIALPLSIDGSYGRPVELAAREKDYFLQFGGMAKKMAYGDNSVMLIQTSSPLRHLHAPDECLRGMGFAVDYKGMSYAPLPTATYIATSPDGAQWRIAVTFYAGRDKTASNVAEAVWRWMQRPGTTWHALQRITPATLPDAEARQWDGAVFSALDLTPHHAQEIAYAEIH
ncbi:MAG: exosortase T [Alphaproteobacteria bacterium]